MADRFTVHLPAGKFSYLEHGQGDPIVFLHALGRDASDWLTVMDALDSGWRCIALDQRGHGQSVRPGTYSFEHLEKDLRDFTDKLGLDQFVLVAHSMGGTVGWLFAEKAPERLKALIVEDTQIPIDRHEYPDIPAVPPAPVVYDWEVRRQLFRQLNSPDPAWWENLSTVTPPTLLIAGSESEELEETARILPDGELITIEAGHWIHEAEPELFVEAMRSFLGDAMNRRGQQKVELTVEVRGHSLPATLSNPIGRVVGGLVPLHGAAFPSRHFFLYEHLAHATRGAGWATLRYDRRPFKRMVPLRHQVNDALEALRVLRSRTELGDAPVGLWGLSQGAWTAMLAAAQHEKVDLLVLVGFSGVSPGRQMRYATTNFLRQAGYDSEKDLEELAELRDVYERYLRGDQDRRSLLSERARASRRPGNPRRLRLVVRGHRGEVLRSERPLAAGTKRSGHSFARLPLARPKGRAPIRELRAVRVRSPKLRIRRNPDGTLVCVQARSPSSALRMAADSHRWFAVDELPMNTTPKHVARSPNVTANRSAVAQDEMVPTLDVFMWPAGVV